MLTGVSRVGLLVTLFLFSIITFGYTSGMAQSFAGYATLEEIVLYWPAPGDDGSFGSAAQYDIRYANVPLTNENWNEAYQLTNEPKPQTAGRLESMTITGLDNGMTYYFGIKAADECLNWSRISPNILINTPKASFLSVGELTMTENTDKKNLSGVKVFVWVVDENDKKVTGATVTLSWKGPRRVIDKAVTDNDGMAVFNSPSVAAARAFWCAAVINIENSYFDSYDAGENADFVVCDDQLGSKEDIRPGYDLSQNYPNPFNPVTEISFNLPEQAYARLQVFNILGQEIAVLVDQQLPAGDYTFPWNAGGLASGVYFYRLQAGDFVETKKMILVK